MSKAGEAHLKSTEAPAERALLVGVEFREQRRALPRSAALARGTERGRSSLPTQSVPASLGAEEYGAEAGFSEFRDLVLSTGASIVGEAFQRRPRPDPATLVGPGKLEEIVAGSTSSRASVILFDYDLTPTQLRNLENALETRVVDRTQLILDVFARHARTREGQLQVELAQLEYRLPRLAGRGAAMSQLGGGIGTRGPGETQLETDRRRIERRLVHLRGQLESVRRVRGQQRRRREAVPVPTVAMVGYTNAGKSTLFNALTNAGVLSSSRLFSTLDPKLRAMVLPSRRKVLLSDTVGFIRNLPPTLITSFRATLEEVVQAEILIHVHDASSPFAASQAEEVEKVLGGLGVLDKPRIDVYNKIDLLSPARRSSLAPGGLAVSAISKEGIESLIAEIDRLLTADPLVEGTFLVPQKEGGVLAAIEAGTVVKSRKFTGSFIEMVVAGPQSLLGRFQKYRLRAKRLPRKESAV